ncbi:putative disease resistance protein RGA3 isoform X2 [Oryza glaberrima]|uniref:Uncharacterized protein n=2 Tax=Oryza glaberrima TaxID=4538 RepID=I1PD99_ORYGL|nr:putative disease resistance protein RGA3 isoform X2 [Oryza glaberrima]
MTLRFSMAELRLLTFKVEHLLEELRWEAHHNKALVDGHRNRMMRNMYIPLVLPRSMKRKLKMITGQLNALGAEINGFINHMPLVMQNNIVGRVHEKQEIKQKLFCLDRYKHEGLKVLCVVGIEGVGKTALVQLIFDEVNVKEYFSLCIWVNVSRQFDAMRITKRIIEVATCEPLETQMDHKEEKELQSYLQNILHERRFLLVLDDVCDENTNGWEELRTSLASGASGSTVIVTTRELCVARTLEAPASGIIELGPMSDDEIWSIMRQRMLCGLDDKPELIQVGQSLVQKCHGIPLAAVTLGDLLRKKGTSNEWSSVIEAANEWLALAESDMLTTTAGVASVALQMSYEHLQPDTKRCFAFCALFPEAFEVDGDMLIQLWMANDMVWYDTEGMGAWMLDRLQSRSFLQDVSQPYNGVTIYKMHPLVHGIATSAAGKEIRILHQGHQLTEVMPELHHLSVVGSGLDVDMILPNARGIHTLLSQGEGCRISVSNPDFWKSNSLRALDLHGLLSASVPFSCQDMKHLRYLDLSRSWITSLPEDFFMIYNLQTLRLSDCFYLKQLPENMRFMENLRHIYIDGCFRLENMPSNMGQLQNLQTLTTYIVGNGDGYGIEEIKSMDLGGRLEIYNLKNVRDKSKAEAANLSLKTRMSNMLLCWGMFRDDEVNAYNAEEVMEALRTPMCVQTLKVWRYPGSILPIWWPGQTLANLVKLTIKDCARCKRLPPVQYFPSLEVLHLEGMDSLTLFCDNVSMDNIEVSYYRFFWRLKSLILCDMPSLEKWQEDEVIEVFTIPVLEEMKLINCPKLVTIPNVPMLRCFIVEGQNKQQLYSLAPSSSKSKGPSCRLD